MFSTTTRPAKPPEGDRLPFVLLALVLAALYVFVGHSSFLFNGWSALQILLISISLLYVSAMTVAVVILSIMVAGFILPPSMIWSFLVFVPSLYGPWRLMKDLKKRLPSLVTTVLVFLLSAFLVTATWGKGSLSPTFFEKITTDTNGSDSYYHMAISNLIQTESYPITGVDGVLYQQYHYGSHLLFASLAKLLGIDVITVYNLALPLLLVPLLCGLIFQFSTQFATISVENHRERTWRLFVFACFIIGLAPLSIRDSSILWNSVYVSESYIVSLILVFPWLSLFLFRTAPWKKSEVVMAALLTMAIGATKVSTLFILMVFLGFFLFFSKKLFRLGEFALYFFLSFISLIVVMKVLPIGNMNNPEASTFDPFIYYRTYLDPSNLLEHLVFFYFPIWLLLLFNRQQSWNPLKISFACTAFVGAVPSILFNIPGGSAYYFADVTNWLALPFALTLPISRWNWKIQMLIALYVLSLAPSLTNLAYIVISEQKGQIEKAQADSIKYNFLKKLSRLQVPPRAAVWIPRDHRYWSLISCHRIPFLFQDLTGHIQVNGQPAPDCPGVRLLYGFSAYGEPLSHPTAEQICEKVSHRSVYRLESNLELAPICP